MQDQLTLTMNGAAQLSQQCEFYARMHLGQFAELLFHTLDIRKLGSREFCRRRDTAEVLLFEARKYIFPGLGAPGHSYGIGAFDEADLAFDVHQVLRTFFHDNRKPFSYNVLPKAWRCITEGQEIIMLKLEPEHIPVMKNVKEFSEKIESGDYAVIVDFFADPNTTTDSGRGEARRLLKEVAELIR